MEMKIPGRKFGFEGHRAIVSHLLESDLTTQPEIIIIRYVLQNDRTSVKRRVITPKTFAQIRYSHDEEKKWKFLEKAALAMYDANQVIIRYKKLTNPQSVPSGESATKPTTIFEKFINEELEIDLD